MLAGVRFLGLFLAGSFTAGCAEHVLGLKREDPHACDRASDCPGRDTGCSRPSCVDSTCIVTFEPEDTPASDVVAGDCMGRSCDGKGGFKEIVDDTDLPPEDDTECRVSHCENGVPSHVIEQTPGDCKEAKCDFSDRENWGALIFSLDADDIPEDDGKPCTKEGCRGDTPEHLPLVGNACDGVQGGRCDESGECLPTFVVLRVGTGVRSTAGYVERRFFPRDPDSADDFTPKPDPIDVVEIPFRDEAEQRGVTFSDFIRDGAVSLSADGRFTTLVGYGAELGYREVARAPNPPHRVVVRIDAEGNVDTSTVLTSAFDGRNSRAAVTVDGSEFWVGGAGEGVYHIPFGQVGGEKRILSERRSEAPETLRDLLIFDSELYGSSGDEGFLGVFKVGEELPRKTGTKAMMLPGLQQNPPPDPCSFVLFDRDLGTAGPDTLYIADNGTMSFDDELHGIEKWTFNDDDSTWHLASYFGVDHEGERLKVGMQGIAGMLVDNQVILIATTTDVTEPKKVYLYVDDHNLVPTPKLLATAPSDSPISGWRWRPEMQKTQGFGASATPR